MIFFDYGNCNFDTTLSFIFDCFFTKTNFIKKIIKGETKMQKLNLITLERDADAEIVLKLTLSGKEFFLGQDAKLLMLKTNMEFIIPDLFPHKLIFEKIELKNQLDFITQSKTKINHIKLQQTLN